jgi:hypothetical protein
LWCVMYVVECTSVLDRRRLIHAARRALHGREFKIIMVFAFALNKRLLCIYTA